MNNIVGRLHLWVVNTMVSCHKEMAMVLGPIRYSCRIVNLIDFVLLVDMGFLIEDPQSSYLRSLSFAIITWTSFYPC